MKLRPAAYLLFLLLAAQLGCARNLVRWEPLEATALQASLLDDDDPYSLRAALQHQIAVLDRQIKRDPTLLLRLANQRIPARQLRNTYQELHGFLMTQPNPPLLAEWLREKFAIYAMRTAKTDQNILVTSYYVPVYPASRYGDERFRYPIYPLPESDQNLVAAGYRKERYTRYQIDYENAWQDKLTPIAWLESEVDRFFLHVQGSGKLVWPNGEQQMISYAGSNDHPYVSLGSLMLRDGVLPREQMSMQGIHDYLSDNPAEMRRYAAVMPRYIYFAFSDRATTASGAPVTPLRTIAVDTKRFDIGTLAFLQTQRPVLDEQNQVTGRAPLNLLVVAQDTGGGIRGDHIDLFWGEGELAGKHAGQMKERGQLYVLVPKATSGAELPLPRSTTE